MGAVAVELEIRAAGIEGICRGATGRGRTAIPGIATLTRSRICSTAPILTWEGKMRRSVSVGTSACTISTKLAARRIERSMIGPTRTP